MTIPTNPDAQAIRTKSTIDISYSPYDVSSSFGGSLTSESIKSNASGQKIVLMLGEEGIPSRSVYYTPVYAEVISYDEWKKIDRTFYELSP